MLKPGKNNAKLGGVVTVTMWKGMPIYSLTLEERATCPKSCDQWNVCYGKGMPFAHRYDHTHADFYRILDEDLDVLARKYPDGFVVRLHVLGDFFSTKYVQFWYKQLQKHLNLRIFGFTHRNKDGAIGKHLQDVHADFGTRFVIRWSDRPDLTFSANVIKDLSTEPETGKQVVCPQQMGKTAGCNTCGLCWSQPKRQILFVEH
jgi:hypothetical protein